MKMRINTDGFEGYAKRAMARARKLDRREPIKPEITITFDNPLAMLEVLTAERIRLVQKVRTKSSSISALAAALGRDPKSVRRDVLKLERAGVVRTREKINPGHGRVKVVEPVARECQAVTRLAFARSRQGHRPTPSFEPPPNASYNVVHACRQKTCRRRSTRCATRSATTSTAYYVLDEPGDQRRCVRQADGRADRAGGEASGAGHA